MTAITVSSAGRRPPRPLTTLRLMSRALVASSTAVLVCLLGGCATTQGSADDDPPSGTNAGRPADDGEGDRDEEAGEGTLRFGQAFTFENGLTIKVGRPRPFEPGPYAVATRGPAVVLDLTVVNKTGEPFDPNLLLVSMQSGNKQAKEIYDVSDDLGGSPTTKLLDGRESTWRAAYNVKDPADLVLEVRPDAGFTYESVIFTR